LRGRTRCLSNLPAHAAGPNGAGKSCLIEAICFAFGLDSHTMRARTLSAFVNHASFAAVSHSFIQSQKTLAKGEASGEEAKKGGKVSLGSCAVACIFRDTNNRTVIIQRRLRDGKQHDYRYQDCSCYPRTVPKIDGSSGFQFPGLCSRCKCHTINRTELRDLLLERVRLDINCPSQFVIQQSACNSVVQRSPLELLHFLEDIAGTSHLRQKVEVEVTAAAELRSAITALEGELNRALGQKTKFSHALKAAEELEECWLQLENKKVEYIRFELEQRHCEVDACRASLREATSLLDETRMAQQQARAHQRKLMEEEALVASTAAKEEKMVAKLRAQLSTASTEENRSLLECKALAAAVRREHKAAEGLRAALSELEVSKRAAQLKVDAETAALRAVRERLNVERRNRHIRESLIKMAKQGLAYGDENITSSYFESSEKAIDGADEGGQPQTSLAISVKLNDPRVLELEERLVLAQESKSTDKTMEQQQHSEADHIRTSIGDQGEDGVHLRLRLNEAEAAANAITEVAAREVKKAELDESEHQAALSRAEARMTAAKCRFDELRRLVRHTEGKEEGAASLNRADARAATIIKLRQVNDNFRAVQFLCESISAATTDDVKAIRAALGSAMWSMVIVPDRRTALHVINEIRRRRLGVLSCLVLSELSGPATRFEAHCGPAACLPLTSRMVAHTPGAELVIHRLFSKWSLAPNRKIALQETAAGTSKPPRAGQGHVVTTDGECFLATGEVRAPAKSFPRLLAIGTAVVNLQHYQCGPIQQAETEAQRHELEKARAECEASLLNHTAANDKYESARARLKRTREAYAAGASHLESVRCSLREIEALVPAKDQFVGVDAPLTYDSIQMNRDGPTIRSTENGGSVADADGRHFQTQRCARAELEVLVPSAEARGKLLHEIMGRISELEVEEAIMEKRLSVSERELRLSTARCKTLAQALRTKLREAERLDQNSSSAREGIARTKHLKANIHAQVQDAEAHVRSLQKVKANFASKLASASEQVISYGLEAQRSRQVVDELQDALELALASKQALQEQLLEAATWTYPSRMEVTQAKFHAEDCSRTMDAMLEVPTCSESEAPESSDVTNRAPPQTREHMRAAVITRPHEIMLDVTTPNQGSIEARRLMLRAEERIFERKRQLLPVHELSLYLDAASEASQAEERLALHRQNLCSLTRRLEALINERSRIFLPAVRELNKRFREIFRALCTQGDAVLEYAVDPTVLFDEGVTIRARPPRSEWSGRPCCHNRACVTPTGLFRSLIGALIIGDQPLTCNKHAKE